MNYGSHTGAFSAVNTLDGYVYGVTYSNNKATLTLQQIGTVAVPEGGTATLFLVAGAGGAAVLVLRRKALATA